MPFGNMNIGADKVSGEGWRLKELYKKLLYQQKGLNYKHPMSYNLIELSVDTNTVHHLSDCCYVKDSDRYRTHIFCSEETRS